MGQKLLFALSFMFTVISLNSQNVLITQKGDSLEVYEVEISASSVFYKLENKIEATLHKINKSDLQMIKYQDGRKVVINKEKNSTSANSNLDTKNKYTNSLTHSPEIIKSNIKWIEEYNNRNTFKYVKPKNQMAKALLCIFGYKKNSVLFTNDLRIEIDFGYIDYTSKFCQHDEYSDHSNPAMEIKIANTSDNIIYIDLGKSFITQFNNEAVTMYIPTATTISSTKSGGVGVNLGAISNAMGIGGVVNTLSQGVNVGGETTSGTSNVTYSQRIIAVPPKSFKTINWGYLFNDGQKINFFEYYRADKKFSYLHSYKEINRGEKLIYTENDTPLQLSILLSYSNEENCAQVKTLNTQLYLREVLGIPRNIKILKNITPNPLTMDAIFLISKHIWY